MSMMDNWLKGHLLFHHFPPILLHFSLHISSGFNFPFLFFSFFVGGIICSRRIQPFFSNCSHHLTPITRTWFQRCLHQLLTRGKNILPTTKGGIEKRIQSGVNKDWTSFVFSYTFSPPFSFGCRPRKLITSDGIGNTKVVLFLLPSFSVIFSFLTTRKKAKSHGK